MIRDVTWRLDCAAGAGGPWSPVPGAVPTISAPDTDGVRRITYEFPAVGAHGFFRVTVLPGTPPL